MKQLDRIIFFAGVISLVWYLAEVILGFNASGNIPLAFIAVFLWGAHIIVQYVAKSEMSIAVGWSAPAGELNVPARQYGAVFGAAICAISIYGYFAGWAS